MRDYKDVADELGRKVNFSSARNIEHTLLDLINWLYEKHSELVRKDIQNNSEKYETNGMIFMIEDTLDYIKGKL